jgi:hypothetical protein
MTSVHDFKTLVSAQKKVQAIWVTVRSVWLSFLQSLETNFDRPKLHSTALKILRKHLPVRRNDKVLL